MLTDYFCHALQRGTKVVPKTHSVFAGELRDYVLEYGPKQALLLVALICEDQAKATTKEPERTSASINAAVTRDAMKRMV